MVKQIMQWTVPAAVMVLLVAAPVRAEDTVSVLMKQTLADAVGKQVTVLTVDYAPGAASEPHVHPGSVFVYVLEGAVVSESKGEKPMTYAKGQSWYESPKKPHVVSKNASTTEPAKLLVLLLSEEGESLKVPLR
ncbi:MAG: cupin domain-containing protein [Nitrospira sp.]